MPLRGLAAPHSKVLITANGLQEQISTEADADGIFQAPVVFPKEGEYTVSARAQEQDGPLSPPSPSVTFKYDPAWSPPYVVRRVTAYVSYRKVRFDLEAVAPKEGVKNTVTEFVTRGQPTESDDANPLVRQLLDGFTIQGVQVSFWFRGVTPQVTFSDKAIIVRATSQTEGDPPALIFEGLLGETLPLKLPAGAGDNTYILLVSDYEIASVNPLPVLSLNKPVGAWSTAQGSASPSPTPSPTPGPTPEASAAAPAGTSAPAPSPITVSLSFRPLATPANLLDFLRLPPGDLILAWGLSGHWSDVIRLLRNLLLILPPAWMLWLLLRENESDAFEPRLRNQLVRLCVALIALGLIAPLLSFSHPQEPAVPGAETLGDLLSKVIDGDAATTLAASIIIALAVILPLLAFIVLSRNIGRGLAGLSWPRWMATGALAGALSVGAVSILCDLFQRAVTLRPYSVKVFAEIVAVLIFSVFLVLLAKLLYAWRGTYSLSLLVPLFVAGAVAAWPFKSPRSADVPILLSYTRGFFMLLQPLVPYLLLVAVLAVFEKLDSKHDSHRLHFGLSLLVFASYLVGSTVQLFLIPIPLLLGLWIFPRQVVVPRAEWGLLDGVGETVIARRRERLLRLLAEVRPRQALLRLEDKYVGGEIKREEYEQRRAELDDYLAREDAQDRLPGGYRLRDMILSFGLPGNGDWENGKWAGWNALILAAPFSALYLWELLRHTDAAAQPFRPFYIIVQLLVYFAGWYASGLFFGYYYPYLRGETGLKKGVAAAVAVIFCLLPVWVVTLTEPTALFLRVAQTFLFFTVLGFWAFDLCILRDELGDLFEWKSILKIEDVPSLAAFASIALGSLGTATSSVLTGQFDAAFTQVFKLVFQQLSGLPAVLPPH